MRTPLAIVGNGPAAAEAVLALRAHDYQGEIHLFADNQHAPYNPMLGTYLVADAISLGQAFPFGDSRTFYRATRVTAHLGREVTQLDAAERTLTTAEGRTYQYGCCLVASGSRAAVPTVPGLQEALAPLQDKGKTSMPGHPERRVFTLHSLEDAIALKDAVTAVQARNTMLPPGSRRPPSLRTGAPRAAVLGASFAGVKVAAVLLEMGFAVCLIEKERSVFPLAAHPECAQLMEAHLRTEGYDLRLGTVLTGIETGSAVVRLDFAASADTSQGDGPNAHDQAPAQEDFDLVVVCTGSRPSLGFLTPGQVDVDTGILVDSRLRSSVQTLYAAGDVAQGKNLLSGHHEIIGLWSSARYQGRVAGRNLAGKPAEHGGGVPHNITSVGRMFFATIGCFREYDRIEARTEDDTLVLRAWLGDRLAGVNLLGRCGSAGVLRYALARAACGAVSEMEATWTSLSA